VAGSKCLLDALCYQLGGELGSCFAVLFTLFAFSVRLELGGDIRPMRLDFQPEGQPPGAGSDFNREILQPVHPLGELFELFPDLLERQVTTDVFEGERAICFDLPFIGNGRFRGE